MPDEDRDALRTPLGREKTLDEHEERLDALEKWKGVSEYREAGREKKASRALNGVMALAISITSGLALAFFSGVLHL